MHTQANKKQKNKNELEGNIVSQKQPDNKSIFQFEDNRIEAMQQRKLHETKHTSLSSPIQCFWEDYDPRLATHNDEALEVNSDDVTEADVTDFVNSIGSLSFWEQTIEAVYNSAESRVVAHPITGRSTRYYYCKDCKDWYQYEAFDIGHLVDWRTYLISAGVTDMDQARMAYNDLNNLVLECSTCNRSHAFEHAMDGGWVSGEDDLDDDLDDFVVKD